MLDKKYRHHPPGVKDLWCNLCEKNVIWPVAHPYKSSNGIIFCDFNDNDRLCSSAQCVFCLKEGNSTFFKRQFLWGADNICMSWVVRPAHQLIVLAKEERSKLVTPRISGQEGRQLGNLPSIRISCPASCPLRQGGLTEARIMILFSVSSYPLALASSPKINHSFQGGKVWGSSAKGTNLLK